MASSNIQIAKSCEDISFNMPIEGKISDYVCLKAFKNKLGFFENFKFARGITDVSKYIKNNPKIEENCIYIRTDRYKMLFENNIPVMLGIAYSTFGDKFYCGDQTDEWCNFRDANGRMVEFCIILVLNKFKIIDSRKIHSENSIAVDIDGYMGNRIIKVYEEQGYKRKTLCKIEY